MVAESTSNEFKSTVLMLKMMETRLFAHNALIGQRIMHVSLSFVSTSCAVMHMQPPGSDADGQPGGVTGGQSPPRLHYRLLTLCPAAY